MPRKYEPLADHLDSQRTEEISMSFAEVEVLVGELPRSAHEHRAWWANAMSHVGATDGWLAAGWEVASVDQPDQVVTFRRMLNQSG